MPPSQSRDASKGVQVPTDTGTIQEALTKFKSSIEHGLTQEEAASRLKQDGPNAIEEKHINPLMRFLKFLWGPIAWMIEIAAILSAVVRHWEDFIMIFFMLALNAVVGFWEEFKADNEIEALKKHLALHSRVLRDGKWSDVAAKTLVTGDIVMVKLGNVVPADLKLVDGDYLSIDQSALTGESLPVDKKKNDVAYSGSIVRMGQMNGLVVATGMNTLFGRAARLVESVKTVSHFQKAVLKIGNFLILITLGLVALILTVSLYRGDPLVETLLFALILTVAAIPVALPAVLSVTMAVGASVLARMKAIVSRLASIEEMAGMDILCSDKTGTLTKNELKLGKPVVFKASSEQDLILAASLASPAEGRDGIDEAVLKGLSDHSALKSDQIIHFTPFDPVSKRTEAEVKHDNATFKVSKGAPQVILDLVHPEADARKKAEKQVNDLAAKGYRTLGVARTDAQGKWEFLGLLPLSDTPRDDSASTIVAARKMGLQVRMVTGDNLAIAQEVSRELKLGPNIAVAGDLFPDGKADDSGKIDAADGYAQVFPEHKFKIVKALQAGGHIVGMTGDGVNDAPALKQADCGIAVSGATDAARAAADLVLTATGLSVITAAIAEARKIFERMNSYAIYRISETIRVLLFMTLAILLFNFFPVTAVMIVLIAVLNDFPDHDDRLRQHHRSSTPGALGHGTRTYGQLGYRRDRSYRFVQPFLDRGKIPSHGPAHRSEPHVPHPAGRRAPHHLHHAKRWNLLEAAMAQLAPGGCLRDNPGDRNPGRGLRMGHDATGMEICAGGVGLCARMVCPHRSGEDRSLPPVASGHRKPSAPPGQSQRQPSSGRKSPLSTALFDCRTSYIPGGEVLRPRLPAMEKYIGRLRGLSYPA